MPGYTHLQPAQPITAAHWLASFFWMLSRDQNVHGGANEQQSARWDRARWLNFSVDRFLAEN
jgi:hypothetical protein